MKAVDAPLRVGLIGCGLIGRFHSRNLRDAMASNNVSMRYTSVCDTELSRAQAFGKLIQAARVTDDAQELIAAPDLDALYICTHTSEHVDLVIEAARAGKHVFCEKPLAMNLADAERMLDAVLSAGVINQVGLVLRYSPIFRVLEDLIAQENVGELMTAHLRDDQFLPVRGHYQSDWRGDVNKAGGGALIEHSIHDVDLFRRLFGEVDRVSCRTREAPGFPGIEDLALVRFEHANGASTSLTSIWHDIDSRGSTRQLEVFFSKAYFRIQDDYFGAIAYQLTSGKEQVLSQSEVMTRFLALEQLDAGEFDTRRLGGLEDYRFAQAVLAGVPASPDFATAVAAHRIVDACYRSAAAGREMTVRGS